MTLVTADISVSLDGFVAGPSPTLEEPLGQGGEWLHEWMVGLASFREQHGLEGGETNADTKVHEAIVDATGAVVMGRRMFSGGEGPWEEDPNADGWWGDDPPFHVRVFVLTHHPRETVAKAGGTSYTFVTEGITSALEEARTSAGDKDVSIGGGADVIQQCLRAGLLDELRLHVAPVLLGAGVRLFENLEPTRLEATGVIESPAVTHLSFRPQPAVQDSLRGSVATTGP
jgi:dihydrofolate reductase